MLSLFLIWRRETQSYLPDRFNAFIPLDTRISTTEGNSNCNNPRAEGRALFWFAMAGKEQDAGLLHPV